MRNTLSLVIFASFFTEVRRSQTKMRIFAYCKEESKKRYEAGNQPKRNKSSLCLRDVDEVVDADGDADEDVRCQPFAEGPQAGSNEIQGCE